MTVTRGLTVRFTERQAATLARVAAAEDRSRGSVVRRLVDSLELLDVAPTQALDALLADLPGEEAFRAVLAGLPSQEAFQALLAEAPAQDATASNVAHGVPSSCR
jgi:hypothetical protein